MNTHELPSTLAVTSEDASMGIIYVLCAIILIAPVVMFVIAACLCVRDWRRTSAREPIPTRRSALEPLPNHGDNPGSSVRR
jgi:hypothetical protein